MSDHDSRPKMRPGKSDSIPLSPTNPDDYHEEAEVWAERHGYRIVMDGDGSVAVVSPEGYWSWLTTDKLDSLTRR